MLVCRRSLNQFSLSWISVYKRGYRENWPGDLSVTTMTTYNTTLILYIVAQ